MQMFLGIQIVHPSAVFDGNRDSHRSAHGGHGSREISRDPANGVVRPANSVERKIQVYRHVGTAVENAIQTVLSACLDLDVPCGITAGVADIAERLEQGFRFIIVTEAEALGVGLQASGRGE